MHLAQNLEIISIRLSYLTEMEADLSVSVGKWISRETKKRGKAKMEEEERLGEVCAGASFLRD